MDRKYKICFENESVQHSYKVLLQHMCLICKTLIENENNTNGDNRKAPYPPIFPTFKQLETHVRREHEMFYCDLCAEHLKVRSYAN